jgi:hypothetical protein
MRSHWAERVGDWLPAEARRELFLPSLADLEHERLFREGAARSAAAQARLRIWFGAAVIGLFFGSLRLCAADRVQSLVRLGLETAGGMRRRDRADAFACDIRPALRMFRREPGFTAAAALTLALGIGANTALFSVVEAVLLRPLPFPEASRLVLVKHRDLRTGLSKQHIAIGDFVDLAARQKSFGALGGYGSFRGTLIGPGDPVRVDGVTVTPEVLDLLGVRPAISRVAALLSELRRDANEVGQVLLPVEESNRERALGRSLSTTSPWSR